MKRAKSYDDEEFWGADFLGTGCYQFIYEGAGKSEIRQQIGFVRSKPKSEIVLVAPTRHKHKPINERSRNNTQPRDSRNQKGR